MAKKKKDITQLSVEEVNQITLERIVPKVKIDKYCMEIMKIHGANVNLARQIPDVRDGLKPVDRRILYCCKVFYKTLLKKSAQIVGDVLGKFHP